MNIEDMSHADILKELEERPQARRATAAALAQWDGYDAGDTAAGNIARLVASAACFEKASEIGLRDCETLAQERDDLRAKLAAAVAEANDLAAILSESRAAKWRERAETAEARLRKYECGVHDVADLYAEEPPCGCGKTEYGATVLCQQHTPAPPTPSQTNYGFVKPELIAAMSGEPPAPPAKAEWPVLPDRDNSWRQWAMDVQDRIEALEDAQKERA